MPEVFSHKAKKTTSQKTPQSSTSDSTVSKKKRKVNEYSETIKNEVECTNPFAAYAPKPVRARFQSQADNEIIVLSLRRHPITNVPWIIGSILLAFFPFFIEILPMVDLFPPNFRFMAWVAWYMLLFAFIIENFLSWFFNLNIITDERIVDIDFENLLYKRVSSAKINNIEDVTSSTGGFIRSLLDFGTVHIQTAGEAREFEFVDVPHPERVIKILNEMMLEEEREAIEGRVS